MLTVGGRSRITCRVALVDPPAPSRAVTVSVLGPDARPTSDREPEYVAPLPGAKLTVRSSTCACTPPGAAIATACTKTWSPSTASTVGDTIETTGCASAFTLQNTMASVSNPTFALPMATSLEQVSGRRLASSVPLPLDLFKGDRSPYLALAQFSARGAVDAAPLRHKSPPTRSP
jgi:hypothetical protein